MAYVNDKKVNLGTSYDYDNAVAEIASLVKVGAREDGRIYLADVCQAININELSKYKPTDAKDIVHTSTSHKGDSTQDGYFLGYNCYGIKKPYINHNAFTALGPNGVPTTEGKQITGVAFSALEGKWSLSDVIINRIRDFDNYSQVASPNSFTYSTNPFSVTFQCSNPNGAISASATLRYNWDDIIHSDGTSATLGLKSLLACDGVNDKAYLGVVAYRVKTHTPETGQALIPIGVAKIHDTPLGERCSNTGEVNSHNVYFSVDDLIEGSAGTVTAGYSKFYYGETGIQCVPFIAKWSGNMWCFIGLGKTPFVLSSALVANGGSGSNKNAVVITKVVCTLTAVKNSDGSITLGLQGDEAFKVTNTGSGFLAFQANNSFYITPADGASIMVSQTGVRLGISTDDDLDLPGTEVIAGTHRASELMFGRSSSATYQNAPSSKFKPYSESAPFKVGISVVYYKKLETWTYLNGSVEIDPSNLQSTYTITING
jgi:hypothetical protein